MSIIKLRNFNHNKISLVFIFAAFLFIYSQPEYISGIYSKTHFCLHQYFFGFECPGCGMTQAIHEFLHLHLQAAIACNMAIVPLIFFILMNFVAAYANEKKIIVRMRKSSNYFLVIGLFAQYLSRVPNY